MSLGRDLEPINPPKVGSDEHVAFGPLPDRWSLIRDVVVFQGKLFLDGIMDIILSPVSIIAATIDLLTGGPYAGTRFYRLLHLGRGADRWINLFGDADRVPQEGRTPEDLRESNLDEIVDHLEDLVRRQHEKGGVTATAKDKIDDAIDRLQAGLKLRP